MTRLQKMTVAGKEIVHTREVSCSDGDHPLVYYVIGKSNEGTCGYCNKTFVYVETQPKGVEKI